MQAQQPQPRTVIDIECRCGIDIQRAAVGQCDMTPFAGACAVACHPVAPWSDFIRHHASAAGRQQHHQCADHATSALACTAQGR